MTSLPESPGTGPLTCADGPCPAGLNKLEEFSFAESPVPTACCDVAGNKAVHWRYSGPKGTPGCFWPSNNAPAGLRLPCSGNVCDPREEPHVCGMRAVTVVSNDSVLILCNHLHQTACIQACCQSCKYHAVLIQRFITYTWFMLMIKLMR